MPSTHTATQTRCTLHPAYEADYCPVCGTTTPISERKTHTPAAVRITAADLHSQASAEADVRAFAARYPLPNVLSALAACESGRAPWQAVADLFARSLAKALAS